MAKKPFGRIELAGFLERFANDATGVWEWDDVIGVRFRDPELEAIRLECDRILNDAPFPDESQKAAFRAIAQKLRSTE